MHDFYVVFAAIGSVQWLLCHPFRCAVIGVSEGGRFLHVTSQSGSVAREGRL